jgi:hypothetical protein
LLEEDVAAADSHIGPGHALDAPQNLTAENVTHNSLVMQEADPHAGHNHGGGINPKVTQYTGFSLIAGFAIMLILDQTFLILQERKMR